MKEFALVSNTNSDIGFGLRIKDDEMYEEAKRLAQIGYAAWSDATDPDYFVEKYGGKYFTKEDLESFYWMGYQEPTGMILDRYGIEHEFIECFDKESKNIIQDDVIWY